MKFSIPRYIHISYIIFIYYSSNHGNYIFQAHLNTCKHDAIPCSNKCGAMIPRVLMEDHLKYTCAQRRARCEFCAKEFTGHTLEVRKK